MIDRRRWLSALAGGLGVVSLLVVGCTSKNAELLSEEPSRVKSSAPPAALHLIANDPSATREKRAEAVFALFANHLKPPQGAAEVGKLLSGEKWLKEAKLIGVYVLGGLIPVNCRFEEDTAFVLQLFPEKKDGNVWPIYFALSGGSERPEREAWKFLRGDKDLKGNPQLLEFALCFPANEDKPLGRIERFSAGGVAVFSP
jgi:hypothetical protein